MHYDIYNLDCKTFPCWEWQNRQLKSSFLNIPVGSSTIWGALNNLGYYSVCCYTGHEGKNGFTSQTLTYLYRFYDLGRHSLPDQLYLTMTILNAGGSDGELSEGDWRIDATPGMTQVVEIVKLPDWLSVLDYLNKLLPIITQAKDTDGNFG